jgi:membrane-bound acyltransferase YfiQ involved in biofilm formation
MVRRLLLLSGISIFGVVINHTMAWGFIALFWWTDRYLPVSVPDFDQMYSGSYFGLRMIEQLIMFSIPAFLFVSGYFISIATGRQQTTVSWKLVGTRIKNLIIPYLLWSVVMLAFDYLLDSQTFTVGQILLILLTGKATQAFYFVPLLVQLYILSPILVPFAKKNWKSLLLIAALIELGARGLRYANTLDPSNSLVNQWIALTPTWLFYTRMFWFVLGMVLGFHLQTIKPMIIRIRWWLMVGLVVFFIVGVIEWEVILRLSGENWISPWDSIVDWLYSLFFILVYIVFDQLKIPYSKQIGNIGSKSYGIYLSHTLVLIISSKLVYHLVPAILAYQIIYQPLLISLGIAIPLMLMAVVDRSPFRKYYTYIFG